MSSVWCQTAGEYKVFMMGFSGTLRTSDSVM